MEPNFFSVAEGDIKSSNCKSIYMHSSLKKHVEQQCNTKYPKKPSIA